MFGVSDDKPSAIRFFVLRDEDGAPLLGDEEEVLHRVPHVELSFRSDSAQVFSDGEVVVTSSRVLWLGIERSFDFSVVGILLHAVARDPESYPRPCLYCQLEVDEPVDDAGKEEGDEETPSHDEEESFIERCSTGEMYLSPQHQEELEPLFEALSKAALLCPDPDDDDDDTVGEWIFNENEVEQGVRQLALESAASGGPPGPPSELITSEDEMTHAQQEVLQRWESVFVAPGDEEIK